MRPCGVGLGGPFSRAAAGWGQLGPGPPPPLRFSAASSALLTAKPDEPLFVTTLPFGGQAEKP